MRTFAEIQTREGGRERRREGEGGRGRRERRERTGSKKEDEDREDWLLKFINFVNFGSAKPQFVDLWICGFMDLWIFLKESWIVSLEKCREPLGAFGPCINLGKG